MTKKSVDMNLPWVREIKTIDENNPLILPNTFNITKQIIEYCAENNFSKRKQKKLIHQKLKEEFDRLSLDEIERRLKSPESVTEIIALDHNTILEILKKKNNFISKDKMFTIISDLMKGISYVAQYGFDLVLVENKKYELIELDDFKFKYDTGDDLRHVINILQIMDSEYYQFEKLDKFYSGKFIHRDSFFDELKEKKYIEIDESRYLYLDPKIFTEMDRLPEDYPDMTDEILEDLSIN